jgi:hypothetical protein
LAGTEAKRAPNLTKNGLLAALRGCTGQAWHDDRAKFSRGRPSTVGWMTKTA